MAVDCPSGCNHFYGGEVRHDENCKYYPESLTKMYAQLRTENEHLRAEVEQAGKVLAENTELRFRIGASKTYATKFLEERDAALADNTALRETLKETIEYCTDPVCAEEMCALIRKALSTPHPGAAMLERVRDYENSLRQISTEKDCVESNSTGMKQWFKTQGASIAQAVLEKHGKNYEPN